ncbi:MAG: hypothetical protein R2748_04520 [Bryobacterales bacterium]
MERSVPNLVKGPEGVWSLTVGPLAGVYDYGFHRRRTAHPRSCQPQPHPPHMGPDKLRRRPRRQASL